MTAAKRDLTIEKELQRNENHWRWLRVGAATSIFGVVFCALAAALGGAILAGWIVEPVLAHVLIGLLLFAGLVGVLGVIVIAATGSMSRHRLVDQIEAANPPMQDRLNTVVAFEKQKTTEQQRSYLSRVFDQASEAIRTGRPQIPFSPLRTWLSIVFFLLAFAGVIAFWAIEKPLSVLTARMEMLKSQDRELFPNLDLSDPETNVSEFSSSWGDVRISEPGEDQKLTKVDVVPLQVEAASNQVLKTVSWKSSVNGAEEVEHPLDAPPEPNYAAYQPVVYLDEYGLSDWDVLSYYASASTANEETYASDIYFIEIRPFRSDINKAKGGAGGGESEDSEAYNLLSLLTGLIDKQRAILKETHRFAQRPPVSPELKEQDRKKLEAGETDLRDTTTNVYAKVASMENMPVGEALDHLGKAEGLMTKAVGALQDDSAEDAEGYELSALSELVATRKMLQKSISDQEGGKPPEEEPDPVAGENKPKTNENNVSEYRDKEKSAQTAMNELVERQRDLTENAGQGGSSKAEQAKRAGEQRDIQNELNEMKSEFPEMFKDLGNETKETNEAMSDASRSMEKGRGGKQESQRALDKLSDLQDEMKNQGDRRELQHAYSLKRSLDQQIKDLNEMSQQQGGPSSKEQKEAAGAAQGTMEQLKQIAENKPKGLGPELKEALNGPEQQELKKSIDDLSKGQPGEAGSQAAGDTRDQLEKLSQAFEKSQPKTMADIEKNDPLAPGTAEQQMSQGEKQIDSLVKRIEDNKLPSGEELKQQLEEIKGNLQPGAKGNPDLEKKLNAAFSELEKLGDQPAKQMSDERVQRLLAQLETLRVEISDTKAGDPVADLTHLDPEKWPAQYRERLRKYFEKLSEK